MYLEQGLAINKHSYMNEVIQSSNIIWFILCNSFELFSYLSFFATSLV